MSYEPQLKTNHANQPDRLFLSSDDAVVAPVTDITRTTGYSQAGDEIGYSSFTINLVQPIIKARGLQLASFVQTNTPADGPCIPDYTAAVIGFFYYKSATLLTTPTGNAANLYFMTLLASSYSLSASTQTSWQNRYFSSYQDFTNVLNNAATAGGTQTPDIQFYYNSTTNQILFAGTATNRYYTPAGYDDPNVIAAVAANWAGSPAPIPYGYTLNNRIGFDNRYTDFYNQQRVGITWVNQASINLSAPTASSPTGYPNLIRSTSVTLRTNINYQASINSKDNRDVLATIPYSVPFLGVNEFQYALNHYLTNVPDTIQQITIRMYDDAGQPLPMGNNVNTLVELYISYGGTTVVP